MSILTWSNSLIQCFRDNGLDITLINIAEHTYDTGQLKVDYDLVINRVNIMPSATRELSVVFHTQHFLHWLTLADVKVINGAKAHVSILKLIISKRISQLFGLCSSIYTPSSGLTKIQMRLAFHYLQDEGEPSLKWIQRHNDFSYSSKPFRNKKANSCSIG